MSKGFKRSLLAALSCTLFAVVCPVIMVGCPGEGDKTAEEKKAAEDKNAEEQARLEREAAAVSECAKIIQPEVCGAKPTCHWGNSTDPKSTKKNGGCYDKVKKCNDIGVWTAAGVERCLVPGIAAEEGDCTYGREGYTTKTCYKKK